jgi:predicted LPLAT superfamily acyltransferase
MPAKRKHLTTWRRALFCLNHGKKQSKYQAFQNKLSGHISQRRDQRRRKIHHLLSSGLDDATQLEHGMTDQPWTWPTLTTQTLDTFLTWHSDGHAYKW